VEEPAVRASSDVVVGSTVDELVARSHGVDLLLVGSCGWGPVRGQRMSWLRGSGTTTDLGRQNAPMV
jgi:hypothetical protein